VAVGRHTRVPRSYRGMDIFWWLERTGRLARTIDEVADPAAARREPSLQLVGRETGDQLPADLDLGTLQDRGVRLTGRLAGIEGTAVQLQDDLRHSVGDAERRLERLLDSVDRHVDEQGLTAEVWPAERPRPVPIPPPPTSMDLRAEGIGTVLFATGYRPHHPWLRVPVTAADGSIVQYRGVTPAPGLYVVGQRFQHRRDSSFIDGARHDAAAVVGHLRRSRPAGTRIGPRS
jgi:putative flavoprotein involved in K+ transport